MFSFIENYKELFMMGVINKLSGPEARGVEKVHADIAKDNVLNMNDQGILREQGNLTRREMDAVLNLIQTIDDQRGTTIANDIREGKSYDIESLIRSGYIPERREVISDTTSDQRAHRETLQESTEEEIVSFEKNTFQRTLERGVKGDDVKALQQFLLNAGFDPNGVDGSFGRGTQKALLAYQAANDLPESGKLAATETSSSRTLNHMLDSMREPTRAEIRAARRAERQAEREARRAQDDAEVQAETIQFERTLKKGMQGEDVEALQRILTDLGYDTNGIDGKFGSGTQRALKKYQREVLGQSGDGIMDLNGATMNSLTGGTSSSQGVGSQMRRANISSNLGEQIRNTTASVEQMTAFLEATSGNKNVNSIYRAISEGANFEDQGYSILHILQRTLGQTETSRAQGKAAEIYEIMQNDRAKFDRAYEALLGSQYQNRGREADDGLNSQGQRMLAHARKALPWLVGIYLGDIPLPFMRKMVPSGVPLDRAFAFTSWVEGGMKGEFDPQASVETGTETLQHVRGLRNMLATATSYVEANRNVESLENVVAHVKDLIRAYVIHRMGPDAQLIRQSSQEFLEKLFGGGEINRLIREIVTEAENGDVDFNKIFLLEAMLHEEDNDSVIFTNTNGENAQFLSAFSNRNRYMGAVDREGNVIEDYVRAIYQGAPAFRETQREDLRAAGIPDTSAEYVEGQVAPGRYGTSLDISWSGSRVLQELQSVRPTAAKNRDSLGWIMKGIRESGNDLNARKIPYNVLAQAISNGSFVPLSEYRNAAEIVNTGRSGEIVSRELGDLEARGDTHLFHAQVEYTLDGQTLKYDLYLRPDCSNFMMIPEQWDNSVGVGVNAKIPVVIPWNFIIPGTSGATANVITEPGVGDVVTTPGTGVSF